MCRGSTHAPAFFGMLDQQSQGPGQRLRVPGWEEQPGSAVLDYLGRSADVGGHDGKSMQHALEDDHPEWLVAAGDDEDVGGPIPARDPFRGQPAGEVDALLEARVLWSEPLF